MLVVHGQFRLSGTTGCTLFRALPPEMDNLGCFENILFFFFFFISEGGGLPFLSIAPVTVPGSVGMPPEKL